MVMIPHSSTTEQQVLAAIIRKGVLFDVATAAGITADAFHMPDHHRVFEAMTELTRRGTAIDLVTLGTQMPDDTVKLAELHEAIATDVNFPEWLIILRRYQALRLIRLETLRIQDELAGDVPDADKALDMLVTAEERARRLIDGHRVPMLKDTAAELLESMVNAPPPVIPFFPAGTQGAAVSQLHPGEMMVIGARTGLGKTAFACGTALEQLRAGLVVLYFCTESTSVAILSRLAAQHSGVSHFEAQKHHRDLQKLQHFGEAVGTIAMQFDRQLYIHGCENGLITPDTIRGRCREILLEAGRIDVIYIDFLQGVKAPAFMDCRTVLEQTNYNVQRLHDLLSEFRAAGVVLAQFNRSSQCDRAGGMPDITWLKDSSLIEQLAHTVAFLYRKEQDSPTLFYSRKTRNQAPFTAGIELMWNGTGYVSAPRYDSSDIPTSSRKEG